METRDILDYNNVKIGELSLPIGTSEEIWMEKLQIYRTAPVEPSEQ